jgi:hypothetical protein
MIKSSRMRWARNVASVGEKRMYVRLLWAARKKETTRKI